MYVWDGGGGGMGSLRSSDKNKKTPILRHWLQMKRTQQGGVLDLCGPPPSTAAQARLLWIAGPPAGGWTSAGQPPGQCWCRRLEC